MLVSSHLLTEVQQTADRVVILSQGRLVREGSIDELETESGVTVVVRSPRVDALAAALGRAGRQVTRVGPDQLRVRGMDSAAVGHAAFTAGVELHELRTERADLEQLFFSLTQAQYTAPPPGQVDRSGPAAARRLPAGRCHHPGSRPAGPPPPPGYQPGAPAPSPGGAR